MAEDSLRTLIDGIRSRLQVELDAHLGSVTDTHERAIADARQDAQTEAEQRWTSKLDDVRTEWGARLQSEVEAARAEVERKMLAESMRVRLESEQAAAEATAQARRELDEAVSTERTRAHADLERAQAERERAHADLERAHADLERVQADHERTHADRARAQADLERAHADLEHTQAQLETAQIEAKEIRDRAHADLERVQADRERALADHERAQADLHRVHADLEQTQTQLDAAQTLAKEIRERADRELTEARAVFDAERAATAGAITATQPVGPSPSREPSGLLGAVRAIDEASSLSAALVAVVRGAALESPRAALFIVNGSTLQEWPVDGVPSVDAGTIPSDGREAGFLSDVLRSGQAQWIDGTTDHSAPAFAGLAPGRRAIAVPFVLGDRSVAVLYADEGTDGRPLDSWRETVQILGRHASAFIAYLTAVRTAQALRLISGGSGGNGGNATDDEAQGARRYARLLVSEIKLYNETAVRTGRERRDLLQRLKPEIDRARRLYEERIAPSQTRDLYFQQELVQTLADGDRSLLT